jgi:L-ascorbate metabolism protein UlaG (beta-lactamase superfamily)
MSRVELRSRAGGVRTMFARPTAANAVGLAWLGQAGFAIAFGGHRLLIDPYLSDFLAEKYRGCVFPHRRMVPPPVEPAELPPIDFVLCTHRHGDHMDPGALPTIAQRNADCRFIVPRADRRTAEKIGLPSSAVLTIDAGESALLSPDLLVTALPSAHETFQTNARGEHHFLGYLLRLGRLNVYHSGDCVAYEGLAERLRPCGVDLALLPVNGRDERRRRHGVPGNMTFHEAVSLCRDAGIAWLIPHHFGMFEFNTADPEEMKRRIFERPPEVSVVLPSTDAWLEAVSC